MCCNISRDLRRDGGGGTKWAVFSAAYNTLLAWLMAFLSVHALRLLLNFL
jgi:Fe2+ transport system protein B